MALINTLVGFDTDQWTASSGQVVVSDNAVRVNHTALSEYNDLRSNETFDLTGNRAYVRIPDAGDQTLTSHEVIFWLDKDFAGTDSLMFYVAGGNLFAYDRIASVQSGSLASTTYDPDVHKWLQIRESSGQIFWETSLDGFTWNIFTQTATPIDITTLGAEVQCGNWQDEATASYADFDHFNMPKTDIMSSFDWHEGSGGSTASIVPGGYHLNVSDWSLHSGSGAIGPDVSVNQWTLALNITVDSLAETAMMIGDGSQFYNVNGAGRIGIYPNYSSAGPVLVAGVPAEVVFVVSGGTSLKAYINGVQAGSWTGTYSLNPHTFSVMMDSHPSGKAHTLRYWHGVALSAAEVLEISAPPVTTQDIDPSGIASLQAFGTSALSMNLALAGIASLEAFSDPSVSSNYGIVAVGIPSDEALGFIKLANRQILTIDGITSIQAFGTLVITALEPPGPVSPLEPALANRVELALHRAGTKRFIRSDPTDVTLIPRSEQLVDGTKKFTIQSARDTQTFKIIWPGDNGIVEQPPNGTRRFDFYIVGEYDATLAIGDFWKVGDQEFRIEYVYPDNGYEVKAGGVSHGPNPG